MANDNTTPVVVASMSNATYAGSNGKTPVKGVDYFTEADIQSMLEQLDVEIIGVSAISNQEINALLSSLDEEA